MYKRITILLLSLVAITSPCFAGDVTFGEAKTAVSGADAQQLEAKDLDGDSKPDLIWQDSFKPKDKTFLDTYKISLALGLRTSDVCSGCRDSLWVTSYVGIEIKKNFYAINLNLAEANRGGGLIYYYHGLRFWNIFLFAPGFTVGEYFEKYPDNNWQNQPAVDSSYHFGPSLKLEIGKDIFNFGFENTLLIGDRVDIFQSFYFRTAF
ncbi:hypothetical protein WDW89_18460 [Deltaproteobacteria bacterium TL4]